MYVLGFFVGWLGLRARAKHPGAPVAPKQVEDLVSYIAVGVFAGGRIGYMFLYDFTGLIADPLSLFYVWRGGMSFHGGLLGVLLALFVYAKRHGLEFFTVSDFMAPWVPPALGFVRIGNFINSELWGAETSPNAPWAVIVDGVPRHPSQLYEAFLEGAVLFVVLYLFSRKSRPRMAVSGLFLLLYGVFRIAVEFIRLPDNGQYFALGWITKGQVFSTPMVVFGVVLLVMAYRRARRAAGTSA